MSHFLCLVILPEGVTQESAQDAADRLLLPYDENISAQGRFDWCVVGGRWDGWIFGPEQEKKSRDGKGGFNFGNQHHTVSNNCRPVSEIPLNDSYYVPFALLKPDGVWDEQGRMGWFCIVKNEKSEDKWEKHVHAELRKYPEHLAIAIDCHV